MTQLGRNHILVTGGLGHVGSAVIRSSEILKASSRITIVDNLSTQRFCSLFDLPPSHEYRFLEGDVTTHVTRQLLDDVDVVIHLAGTVDPVRSIRHPAELRDNNLRITTHVASVCAQVDVPLIYSSSTSVYTSRLSLVDETCVDTQPSSPYALCKLEEERVISHLMRSGRYLLFRFGTIFGPSIGMQFHTAVNKFCWQATSGNPIEVWKGSLTQVRPYLSLGDCTRILARAVSSNIYPCQVVNAATCNATVQEVINCIESEGIQTRIKHVEAPLANNLSYGVSTDLASSLGFAFTDTLANGVHSLISTLQGIVAKSN
jgi:nucleoside-diphosphate-sugar epimerase